MGLNKEGVNLLQCDISRFRDQGVSLEKALMLGRQDVSEKTTPEEVFEDCGFKEIHSLDITDSEGANIIHDMNNPIPNSLFGKFDFIFDGGTMEHVFDTKNFLSNCVRMLKTGGIICHGNPLNNMVNHGFYQMSPALYFAFYKANGYFIEKMAFNVAQKISYDGRKNNFVQGTLFESTNFTTIKNFALTSRIVLPEKIPADMTLSIIFWARKLTNVKEIAVPSQPIYCEKYNTSEYERFKKIIRFTNPKENSTGS